MIKIYKTSDRLPVKIDGVTVEISTLTFEQKAEIQAELIKGDPLAILRSARMAVKYAVKGIKGVQNLDGSEYEVDMDNGVLSDDCVDDLLNIDQDDKLSLVCTTLLNGIPKEFIDPQTGEKIKGITIQRGTSRKKK